MSFRIDKVVDVCYDKVMDTDIIDERIDASYYKVIDTSYDSDGHLL